MAGKPKTVDTSTEVTDTKEVTLESLGFKKNYLHISEVLEAYAEKLEKGYGLTLVVIPTSSNVRFIVDTIDQVEAFVKMFSCDALFIETPNGNF